MTETTTGKLREALTKHFQVQIQNPSWDVIGEIAEELDLSEPDRCEAEDALYRLWGRGTVTF